MFNVQSPDCSGNNSFNTQNIKKDQYILTNLFLDFMNINITEFEHFFYLNNLETILNEKQFLINTKLNLWPLEDYRKITKSGLLEKKYIPVYDQQYIRFFKIWEDQAQMFWVHNEIPLYDDKIDYTTKLTDEKKKVVKRLFMFFAETDKEVQKFYTSIYPQVFQPTSLHFLFAMIASIETIHAVAYLMPIQTILSPLEFEETIPCFMNLKEIADKFDYINQCHISTPQDVLKTLFTFGGLTEGMFLYGSFAIFLYFSEVEKKLNGIGQIVAFSMRDESLHVKAMGELFHMFCKENPYIMTRELKNQLKDITYKMVQLECDFISVVLEDGDIDGLKKHELHNYIEYIADRRLEMFGLEPIFGVKENPLFWMGIQTGAINQTNFFEQTVAEYTKISSEGGQWPWEK